MDFSAIPDKNGGWLIDKAISFYNYVSDMCLPPVISTAKAIFRSFKHSNLNYQECSVGMDMWDMGRNQKMLKSSHC